MGIDKITLSVIQAGLQQVCDEMDLTFSLVQLFLQLFQKQMTVQMVFMPLKVVTLLPKELEGCPSLLVLWSILQESLLG